MSLAATSDIDELIDGTPPKVREITSFRGRDEEEIEGVSLDLSEVHAGVSVYWLSTVFGMATNTVKKKLADCPAMKRARHGNLYDLREACAYLVKPKVDIDRFIKNLKADDLPPKLHKDYWEAKLKYQKWAVEAGELWRTEDVLDVLGTAFNRIRTATQLWSVAIERAHGLSDEQRKLLTQMSDTLLDDLYNDLVSMPKQRATVSLRDVESAGDDVEDLIGA